MREHLSVCRELRLTRRFDPMFELGHHVIELPHRCVPLFRVVMVEGVVVVAAEFLGRLTLELVQVLNVPEPKVVNQLAN
jgi:hypothetical protein